MAVKLWTKRRKGRTLEQKLDDQVKAITKLRKADAAAREKKKSTWVSRLKKNVREALKIGMPVSEIKRITIKKSRHSPAGKKYLAKKRGY